MKIQLLPETLQHGRPCEKYHQRLQWYGIIRSTCFLSFILLSLLAVLSTMI